MTPDEFRITVLPKIIAAWEERCYCDNPVFRKLLAFNPQNYGIGPVGLADAEILIDAIIRQRFSREHEPVSHRSEVTQTYRCPQCDANCTEVYEEFNINMFQSTVTFDGDPTLAPSGFYLVGFYGFDARDFEKIDDFQRAPTSDDFLRQLRIG